VAGDVDVRKAGATPEATPALPPPATRPTPPRPSRGTPRPRAGTS
jgi:hypothetical protein